MTLAFVAIGANLNDPQDQVRRAIAALGALPGTTLLGSSSLYGSKPMGPQDQPDYINAVAQLATTLAPLTLLDELQRIEREQGRVRKDERWGPRTLDLDLLLFGDQIIESPRLTVPHYGMKQREFVLLPLYEIVPDLRLPCGSALRELALQCPPNGLQIIAPAPSV